MDKLIAIENKKEIIHVITTLDIGGAEKQLCLLTEMQADRGFKVKVIYLKGKGSLIEAFAGQGVYIESKFANRNLLFQILGLSCYFRKSKPYIIHAHLPRAELISAISTFAQKKLRLICSKHNTEKFWPTGLRVISRRLSLFVQRSSCGTIFISNTVKKFITMEVKECEVSRNTAVIHYGYRREASTITESNLTFPKSEVSEVAMVTVARLVPQKNLENLMVALYLARNNQWTLDIYGSGNLELNLRKLITSLGLEGRVRLMGKRNEIHKIIRRYDLFVLPSKYEGLGLALLEAIDCEIPVATSSIDAFAEILGEDYPYLFTYDDTSSIISIIQDLALHDKVDRSAFAVAKLKKFDPHLMEQKIIDFYISCRKDMQSIV